MLILKSRIGIREMKVLKTLKSSRLKHELIKGKHIFFSLEKRWANRIVMHPLCRNVKNLEGSFEKCAEYYFDLVRKSTKKGRRQ